MKNFILSILAVFLLYSCHQKKQTAISSEDCVNVQVRNINLNQDNQILLSEFVDSIDIIPLEFTDSCILKEIEKIVFHNENIFLIESHRPQTVYRFDKRGNFLNWIGSHGQGPAEIIELLDFSINEEQQIVYLWDNARQVVLSYSFDGQFIEKIKMNQYADKIEYNAGHFYLYRDQPIIGKHLYSFIIRNMNGEIESMFFPSKQYPINQGNRPFSKKSEGLFFHKSMNDTVYWANGAKLESAYYFDFGSLRFTPKEIEDIYMQKVPILRTLLDKKRLSGIDNFYSIGNWVYFNSIYKILQYSFLYNLETNELKVGSGLLDDIEYMFYNNVFYGQTDDVLIGLYDINGLIEDIDRYVRYEKEKRITGAKKKEQMQKMERMMRGDNTEEMNPWVLLYHLKKN